MARCELTITTKVHKRLAWTVAYALVPAVYFGLISEQRAGEIAARFIRVTTTVN